MKKYLIAYGFSGGDRAMNNQTFLISAKNEDEAVSIFRKSKGSTHKVQLIKEVNY